MAMPDLQRYPWNFNMIKNVEDIVVYDKGGFFLWVSPLLLINKKFASLFAEKPQVKINSLKKHKHWYLIQTWTDKAFKGTFVTRTLPSLQEGSLKITLAVPLKSFFFKEKFRSLNAQKSQHILVKNYYLKNKKSNSKIFISSKQLKFKG